MAFLQIASAELPRTEGSMRYGAHRPGFFAVLLAVAALAGANAHAASDENFANKTTSDYLALCQTAPDQANYVAAVHFCQGFASGAYQYYLALASLQPEERFVCLPTPQPSRDQALAAFVAWTKAHPDHLNDPPVDSLFRFLGETYPCSAKQASQ
jgi:hypothetical protein